MKTIELIKTGYYNENRIYNYVRERVRAGKATIENTEGEKIKISVYDKSKWKLKEIVPLDSIDYVGATRYLAFI